METNSFDAIVVGSGMSGGWAAKELTEKGLKTLVLERGQMVRHPDYPTAFKDPWDLPFGNRITQETRKRKYVWSRTGYPTPANELWFTDDLDNPYVEEQPFDWLRAYHVGGRSMHWARQSYRFSPMDFEANAKEGVGIPWPVSYEEIAPWYDKAEIFAGISGSIEGMPQLPDGKFLPPHDLNCVEVDFKKTLDEKMSRKLIIGRCANLTAPLTHKESPQRGTCQARNMCIRGCPFGGYFSSVSSTLPSAERTGNMTLLPNQIVYELIYGKDKRDYLRGFGYQGRAARAGYGRFNDSAAIGEDLKKEFQEPGPWNVSMTAFGEILPHHENRARLDRDKKDKHGLPLLAVNAVVRENERKMEKDMRNDAAEMLEAAGFKNVTLRSDSYNVGNSIHESGTARMGNDPKKSV